jgi:hypothetical protein
VLSSHRHRRVCVVLILTITLVAVACIPLNPKPEVPSKLWLKQVTPSIRGVITRVSLTEGVPHAVFVEGSSETDTTYDVASVIVRDSTRIYLQREGSYSITSASQLTTGLQVEATFTGTILEVYPVRAEADEILILEASR